MQPSAAPGGAVLHAVGAYAVLLAGCSLLLAVCTDSWVDSKPNEGEAIASCSYVNAAGLSVTLWAGQATWMGHAQAWRAGCWQPNSSRFGQPDATAAQ